MKTKRILSFLLTISLLFGNISPAFAAEDNFLTSFGKEAESIVSQPQFFSEEMVSDNETDYETDSVNETTVEEETETVSENSTALPEDGSSELTEPNSEIAVQEYVKEAQAVESVSDNEIGKENIILLERDDSGQEKETGKFVCWSDAIAYLKSTSDASKEYIAEFLKDVELKEALTMPAKVKSITFRSGTKEGSNVQLTYLGDIKLVSDTAFENMDLKAEKYNTKDQDYDEYYSTVNLNGKSLKITNGKASFTSIAGNKDAKLGLEQANIQVKKAVTSLGFLDLKNSELQAENVTVTNTLTMQSSEIGCNAKVSLKDIVSLDAKNIIAYGGNTSKNILNITGSITSDNQENEEVKVSRIENGENITRTAIICKNAITLRVASLEKEGEYGYQTGTLLCNAPKAGAAWFVTGSDWGQEEQGSRTIAGAAYKKGNAVYCGESSEIVRLYSSQSGRQEDFVYEGGFSTLQDALSEIDKLAVKTNFYRIELRDVRKDFVTFSNKNLTFPAKTAGITIAAGDHLSEAVIYLKDKVALKSDLVFEDIIFASAKNVKFELGNFGLTLTRCSSFETQDGSQLAVNENGERVVRAASVNGSGTAKNSRLILFDTALWVAGAVKNVGSLVYTGEQAEYVTAYSLRLGSIPLYPKLEANGAVQVGSIELKTEGTLAGLATVKRSKDKTITGITSQITIAKDIVSESGKVLYLDLREKQGKSYIRLDLNAAEAKTICQTGFSLAKGVNVTYSKIQAAQLAGKNLVKKSGNLIYYEKEHGIRLSYMEGNTEIVIPCYSFSDAVTEISNRKVKQDYIITLLSANEDISADSPKALTMPNKKYVNSLVIQAEPEAEEARLCYRNSITFTSHVTLKNVAFVQMLKSGSVYLDADEVKKGYPAAVTVNTGGFDLNVEGKVTFNTPVVLKGGKKGNLTLTADGTLNTKTNEYSEINSEAENVIYGTITDFKTVTMNGCGLELIEYETAYGSKKYKPVNMMVTDWNLTDGEVRIRDNKGKASVKVTNLCLENGTVKVGGKLNLTNTVIDGTADTVIQADKDFNITGTLTSFNDNAMLLTRLKGAKKAPYLNISGKVVRGDDINAIYVGVYPEITAKNPQKAVKLTGAPKVTGQLLTAKKALVTDFRPMDENYAAGSGEYSPENPTGYRVVKSGSNIYVYEGSKFISEKRLSPMTMNSEYWQQLEKEARMELQKIAQEKNLYALVYLTDSYPVKAEPEKNADTVMSLGSGHTVQVMGMCVQWIYQEEWEEYLPLVWYQVQFYVNEVLYTGYIEEAYLAYSDELLLQWKEQFQELFPLERATLDGEVDYSDVEQFPNSYQVYLKTLKEQYPDWIFVPMEVTYKGEKRKWEDCVREQLGDYSWIWYTAPEAYRGEQINSNWYYASLEGIAHYMDPRNFLTKQNIFQFELNSYNETYHTPEAVQKFLDNTFMEGVIPGEDNPNGYTHAQVIWNSGKSRKLSPFVLAARVIQEQGTKGTSAMISGTYPGYEGYYNYYNIGASGKTDEEVLKNGLSYAKSKGWDTRIKALDEGADTLSNNYILKGQDTLYLQKFDVEKSRGYLFQYMQNISAAYTEGRSMRSMYEETGVIERAFVFKIPVFSDMPVPGYELQTKNLEMEKGTTASLRITYSGMETVNQNLKCDVKPENVVSVSEDGTVTALENGTAMITVSVQEGNSVIELGTCTVNVISPMKGISLDRNEIDLYLYEETVKEIPVLNEEGKTQYRTQTECPTEVTLTVQYDPFDTTDDRSIKWESENPEIAEVIADETDSSKAKISAKADGTTVITATSLTEGYTASTEVTVHIPMTEATLNRKELTLYRGQTETLTVSYFPNDTTDNVRTEWYSEHPDVVDVEDGKIVAKGVGTAVIHAAIGPFDGQQEELTCKVTVKSYQVKFMDENGKSLITVSGEYGKELSTLSADGMQVPWELKADGKVFIGWYTQTNGEGYAITQDSILYEDMILYPHFIDEKTEFYVKPIGNLVYTGGDMKPEAVVFHKGELLAKGKDYTVSYENNRSVGSKEDLKKPPKMIVKGKGEYAGKAVTEPFSILPKDISQSDVKVSELLTSYTGQVQKMRPVIKDNHRTLQINKDYALEYVESGAEAYCEAGTYAVKITGKGNYTGSRMAYITITRQVLISQVDLAEIKDVTWKKDEECVPVLDLSYQGISLVQDTDYTVMYKNHTEVGTATAVISGKGDYTGTREETFQIVGSDFTKVDITGITDMEYTGEAIELTEIEVRDESGQLLEKKTDYEIRYLNHTNPGRATVIFTGKGGFEGTVKKNFTILPYDIEKNEQTYTSTGESGQEQNLAAFQVKMIQKEVVYDKAGAKPELIVTYKGRELTEDVDYTLDYKNNDNVSGKSEQEQAVVVITGKGKFTGSISESYFILSKDLSEVRIFARDVKFRNKKGFCFIEPELKEKNGRMLVKGIDYREELTYTYGTVVVLKDGTIRAVGDQVEENDIPVAGTEIVVTVSGTGNYTGERTVRYLILKNDSWSYPDIVVTEPEMGEQSLKETENVLSLSETRVSFQKETLLSDENNNENSKKELKQSLVQQTIKLRKFFDTNCSEEIVKLREYYLKKQGIDLKPLPTVTGGWHCEKLPDMLSMIRYVNMKKVSGISR